VIVVNDLGAVTYYTEAPILDMFGLGNIEPIRIMRRTGEYTRADVQEWTGERNPQLAILQLSWGWVVPRIPAPWIKVAEVVVPTFGQRIGFFAIDPSAAALLRADVEHHYGVIRASAGYRIEH
jgi:hypothetical protein